MKPPLFDYTAPLTMPEAISALAGDSNAMVLAGGQSLIPALNLRLASPSKLVDIQHVGGLADVTVADDAVIVGAMVRHRRLELDDTIAEANPLLRAAMAHVAHVPIRNRGTVVGSLCHADAAAEMPMMLVLLGGSVVAEGPKGRRTIEAQDFFKFHLTTTRAPDEIVVEARFPRLPPGSGWAFEEFTRRHGDYAIAAVGATVIPAGGRRQVSLAACGISSKPVRLVEAEAILNDGNPTPASISAAAEAAKAAVTAPDDMHASNAYRRHLLAALVRRTVQAALARAN